MKKTSLAVATGLVGMILAASFSVRHQSFTSGLGGVLGATLLVGAYLLDNWERWRAGDRRVRRVTGLLVGAVTTLIILNVIVQVLG